MEKRFVLETADLRIACKLSEPEYGEICRVVLGVHGIGGSTEDPIQLGIAEEMAMFDAATLNFDFPGHGASPMEDTDQTVANCVASLLAVAHYAKERYPQVEDLCLFASGFGAYITLLALEALEQLPGKLRLVVHTPSVRMHDTLLAMVRRSRETFRMMDRVVFPVARPLTVTYRLYEEMLENIAFTSYETPMLILQGESDAFIRLNDLHQFRRINEQAKLVTIPGASHQFLEDGAWDMVLDLTRDWFAFEQVLLSDWE